MNLQQAAFLGADRSSLRDEMKRRGLKRQIEQMDPSVLNSLVNQAQGGGMGNVAAAVRGAFGGGRGGGGVENGGVSKNNPGKIDVPDIDRDANRLKEIEIANAEQGLWERQQNFQKANPLKSFEQKSQEERQRLFNEYDKATSGHLAENAARDARYTGEGTESNLAAAIAAKMGAGNAPASNDKNIAKVQAALLKYIAAEKYHAAMSAIGQDPKKAAAAAQALEKAKANYHAAESMFGGSPGQAQTATVSGGGNVMYGMGPNGTPLLTNRSEDDLQRAMGEKFGGESRYVPPAQADTPAPAAWAPSDKAWMTQFTPTPEYSKFAKGKLPELGEAPAPITPDETAATVEPTVKIVNGASYRKVQGGWELVGK